MPVMVFLALAAMIFFSRRRIPASWTAPRNIGGPINDHQDQYSLFITADGLKGYYSHEETLESGLSKSRIIEATIPMENQLKYRSNYVKGIIRDKLTQKARFLPKLSLSTFATMLLNRWSSQMR